MGEAVFEIYTKYKLKQLSDKDLQYFCDSVGLDSKQSTFRKYKAIGENANQFRAIMDKLPATFSVLYEMATLSGDDFEKFVIKHGYSKNITLLEFKKITNNSTVLTQNKMINPPVQKLSSYGISKLIKEINRFSIDIARDLPESQFNKLVELLAEYRNKGWIRFDYPVVTEYAIEEDKEEFNSALTEV